MCCPLFEKISHFLRATLRYVLGFIFALGHCAWRTSTSVSLFSRASLRSFESVGYVMSAGSTGCVKDQPKPLLSVFFVEAEPSVAGFSVTAERFLPGSSSSEGGLSLLRKPSTRDSLTSPIISSEIRLRK